MDFFDWDGDGKHTLADDFIEYQVFKEVMGMKDNENDSDNLFDDEDEDF